MDWERIKLCSADSEERIDKFAGDTDMLKIKPQRFWWKAYS